MKSLPQVIAGLLAHCSILNAQGLRVWRSPMATTWPGSCTVFMTWPWPWIYIRAWQDLETGLKRTLTFKNSEIISTWHFQNSNNNSTWNFQSIKYFQKSWIISAWKIQNLFHHFMTRQLACMWNWEAPTLKVEFCDLFIKTIFIRLNNFEGKVCKSFSEISIWAILEFSWRCWVDLGCVRKGGWRGRKNKLVAQERFSVSTDIGGQGNAVCKC